VDEPVFGGQHHHASSGCAFSASAFFSSASYASPLCHPLTRLYTTTLAILRMPTRTCSSNSSERVCAPLLALTPQPPPPPTHPPQGQCNQETANIGGRVLVLDVNTMSYRWVRLRACAIQTLASCAVAEPPHACASAACEQTTYVVAQPADIDPSGHPFLTPTASEIPPPPSNPHPPYNPPLQPHPPAAAASASSRPRPPAAPPASPPTAATLGASAPTPTAAGRRAAARRT